jgi:D-alanyl-D-alanine carboxypeptidase/D-alanyl-D-alanine-endopeptidase (penicillin-binding protein 4)
VRQDLLYAHDAQKLLLPASNVKVLTLAAAAERLGWTFSFETQIGAAGPVDRGVLYGDLVVVGGGDPGIDDWDGHATRLFTAWAEQLKASGIWTITGRVVGDDNRFADRSLGSGWAWDDLDRSFATAAGALQFNQNTARLTVAPATAEGDPARVSVEPFGSGLALRNQVLTTRPDTPALIETRRGADNPTLEVHGSVPLGSAPSVRNVSVYNPTLYFVSAMREALVAAGIDVRGPAIDIDDTGNPAALDRGAIVLTHRSPPLSALAVTMMKVSQNLFAESVLLAMGGPATVRAVLADWGVGDGSLVLADGSGLSRYNLATADALVAVLARVHGDDRLSGPFQATLPIAGRDGTLAARMAGTAAEGNARAKTGAFSNARSLSGYVQTADGEPLVFSILANNFGTDPGVVEDTADAIVVKLAEFSRSSALQVRTKF